jgi:hypothetical protein
MLSRYGQKRCGACSSMHACVSVCEYTPGRARVRVGVEGWVRNLRLSRSNTDKLVVSVIFGQDFVQSCFVIVVHIVLVQVNVARSEGVRALCVCFVRGVHASIWFEHSGARQQVRREHVPSLAGSSVPSPTANRMHCVYAYMSAIAAQRGKERIALSE